MCCRSTAFLTGQHPDIFLNSIRPENTDLSFILTLAGFDWISSACLFRGSLCNTGGNSSLTLTFCYINFSSLTWEWIWRGLQKPLFFISPSNSLLYYCIRLTACTKTIWPILWEFFHCCLGENLKAPLHSCSVCNLLLLWDL